MQENVNLYSHRSLLREPLLYFSLPQKRRGGKKTSESFEMHLQAAFIPPSASQSWPHESKLCTWIQCSFAAVCIHASALQLQALQDTSVMGSVSSIVGLLDGPADSTFPGGYLRSMMTLHLPQPALLQPRCIKTESGGNARCADNPLLAFLFLWQIH